MISKPRVHSPEAVYHVISNGLRREYQMRRRPWHIALFTDRAGQMSLDCGKRFFISVSTYGGSAVAEAVPRSSSGR
jgi:hypothetical protein